MATDEPTTTNVALAYLLLRLPTGDNTVFNSEILEIRKCLFAKFPPTIFGCLSESTKMCAMFLDILHTESGDEQPNWYIRQSLCMSKLDNWKEIRLKALVKIFRNGTITLRQILQTEVIKCALEWNIRSNLQGPAHCQSCDRLLSAPLGFLKEQCECGQWVCLKESCYVSYYVADSLNKHIMHQHIENAKLNECLHCGNSKDRSLNECSVCGALWCVRGNCRFETRSKRAMKFHETSCRKRHNETEVIKGAFEGNTQSKPERPAQCRSCKRDLSAPFGNLKEKCECGQWVCLKSSCYESYSLENSLSKHITLLHFQNAKLDECSHCGNFKDRSLNKCSVCGALWCVRGTCRFETRNKIGMGIHERQCGNIERKIQENIQLNASPNFAPKLTLTSQEVRASVEQSVTEQVSTCGSCGRRMLVRIGIIRMHCVCGKWVCTKRNCSYWNSNPGGLTNHIEMMHFLCSNTDECVHCENHKNRELTRCPICQAYWCTNGECRYETLQFHLLEKHQENCRAHLV